MKAQRVIAEGKSKQQQQQNNKTWITTKWVCGTEEFYSSEKENEMWKVSSVTKGKINWWQEERMTTQLFIPEEARTYT